MCLSYPGTVKKVKGNVAMVRLGNSTKKVNTGGMEIKIGDSVLVQMGIIINKISISEKKEIEETFRQIQNKKQFVKI